MANEQDVLELLRKLSTPGMPLASDSAATQMARAILAYVHVGRELGAEVEAASRRRTAMGYPRTRPARS